MQMFSRENTCQITWKVRIEGPGIDAIRFNGLLRLRHCSFKTD